MLLYNSFWRGAMADRISMSTSSRPFFSDKIFWARAFLRGRVAWWYLSDAGNYGDFSFYLGWLKRVFRFFQVFLQVFALN